MVTKPAGALVRVRTNVSAAAEYCRAGRAGGRWSGKNSGVKERARMYTYTPLKSEPQAYKNGTPASPAHALAIRVLPAAREKNIRQIRRRLITSVNSNSSRAQGSIHIVRTFACLTLVPRR